MVDEATSRTSALSIPIPNAVVARRPAESATNASCTLVRSSTETRVVVGGPGPVYWQGPASRSQISRERAWTMAALRRAPLAL